MRVRRLVEDCSSWVSKWCYHRLREETGLANRILERTMEKRSRDVSQCEVWILLKSSRLAISRRQFTFELSSDSEIVLSFCRIVNLYCYICN